MMRPVILTIDDVQVLRAVEHNLRQHYAAEYRVLRAESPALALDTLRKLKLRNEAVALRRLMNWRE
jgi:thioredoxin reductase (NADPH)